MFKLVVSDTVEFAVCLSVNDGGQAKEFRFRLQGRRISQAEISGMASGEGQDTPTADFLRGNITGWDGQTLVVNEDNTPAKFSAEAFDAMLGLVGAGNVIFADYLGALAASASTRASKASAAESRAKN